MEASETPLSLKILLASELLQIFSIPQWPFFGEHKINSSQNVVSDEEGLFLDGLDCFLLENSSYVCWSRQDT